MARATELIKLMDSFQNAVGRCPHDPAWRDQVGERLSGLRRAFAEHIGVTEGPDGLYHELVDQEPRLAPGVYGLVRDHRALLADIDGLRARVTAPAPGGGVEPDDLHGWARRIVDDLNAHRQRGADLVYEAYDTDLGGET